MKILSKTAIPATLAIIVFCSAQIALAATTNVAYGGGSFTFRPSDLSIKAGDTVIWTSAGGTHNVVGSTPGTPLCGCTGTGIPGFTNTFAAAGTYLYYCSFHQSFGMTGVVRVASSPVFPAVLTNAASFTNGSFVFTVISTASHTNIVQASTQLAKSNNWVSLATNFPATNTFNYTDTTAHLFTNRFYRVVEP